MAHATNEEQPETTLDNIVYIVDLMALIRTMRDIPETFEDLAFRIIKSIRSGYKRVDIVSDSYHKVSIKSGEREKRGSSGKILLKSSKSKIPREFNKFLLNNENKQKMVEIFFDVLEEKHVKVLNLLRTNQLVLACDEFCKILTLANIEDFRSMISNQEEADTKVILHSHQVLDVCETNQVLLRSPSGDTDILILVVSLLYDYKERIVLDNGVGNSRKLIWLGNIDISRSTRNSLLGFHAFTGNDYVSSLFKKGKSVCWKVLQRYSKFESPLSALGNTSRAGR